MIVAFLYIFAVLEVGYGLGVFVGLKNEMLGALCDRLRDTEPRTASARSITKKARRVTSDGSGPSGSAGRACRFLPRSSTPASAGANFRAVCFRA